MKTCSKCGTKDADHDKTGIYFKSDYYCFSCKNKTEELGLSETNHVSKKEVKAITTKNIIAVLLKGIAIGLGGIWVLFSLYTFTTYNNMNLGGIALYSSSLNLVLGLVASLIIYALGEGIQLLQTIANNTDQST